MKRSSGATSSSSRGGSGGAGGGRGGYGAVGDPDKISRVQAEIDQTKDIMVANIGDCIASNWHPE